VGARHSRRAWCSRRRCRRAGIYSGFEHCENAPQRPGSEEYLDSEKYETKSRELDGPLLGMFERLNRARREQRALQRLDNIVFLETNNDALIAYIKRSDEDFVITVVNIDFSNTQEGLLWLGPELGVPEVFEVADILDDVRYELHAGGGHGNYIRLSPWERVAHVFAVRAR
jgi:starch synthase (maltosyl-transferring)